MMKNETTTRPRPQDLKFTKEELDKAFGPKLTRQQWLDKLRRDFDRAAREEQE